MYKCKKCESNEYIKAGFVKGKPRYKCKKGGSNLFQQGIKGGANKKSSKQCDYTLMAFHS